MTERERFHATMHYRPRDRSPICDFGFWDETLDAWRDQGLPSSVTKPTTDEHFGMDPFSRCVLSAESSALVAPPDPTRSLYDGVSVGLVPPFETVVIEERGDATLVQQPDGVRVLKARRLGSIPRHESHLLVDRAAWRTHYLPRLQPDDPRRYPSDWAACAALWRDAMRPLPIFLNAGSLYGWIRNWMGLEAVSLLVDDDPAWFEEMIVTIADCIVGTLTRVLETGGRFDGCAFWEDMCYNGGPLLGPPHFRRFLVPHYRRICDLLRRHGIDVIWVDCDVKIDRLLPLWLESGVNCMFPVEIGTWQADPLLLRARFGRELLLMGGFDKRILVRGPGAIDAEVDRLAPLVEQGGYIGFCDHRVPPDVPLAHYLHYLETVRRVWGGNINLRPLHR